MNTNLDDEDNVRRHPARVLVALLRERNLRAALPAGLHVDREHLNKIK